jgi:hypothetical protein
MMEQPEMKNRRLNDWLKQLKANGGSMAAALVEEQIANNTPESDDVPF